MEGAKLYASRPQQDTSSTGPSGVPIFPHFRPLGLEDKSLFDELLGRFPAEISEQTFTNLFAWRQAYNFGLSFLHGYVIVGAKVADTIRLFDPIGAREGKRAVIAECFRRKPVGTKLAFNRLPESTISLFADDREYAFQEDRDNFDYVHLAQDLRELKGGHLDGKRNFVKRFKETYSFEYDALTAADIPECLAFEEEWCQLKGCTNGLSQERQALQEMLSNFDVLGFVGGVIRIGGRIVALSLGEKLNATTLVVHIEKAMTALVGVYQAINMFFAQSVSGQFLFINREQDLGLPGLRQAKTSYQPHHLVKKYTLLKN